MFLNSGSETTALIPCNPGTAALVGKSLELQFETHEREYEKVSECQIEVGVRTLFLKLQTSTKKLDLKLQT